MKLDKRNNRWRENQGRRLKEIAGEISMLTQMNQAGKKNQVLEMLRLQHSVHQRRK